MSLVEGSNICKQCEEKEDPNNSNFTFKLLLLIIVIFLVATYIFFSLVMYVKLNWFLIDHDRINGYLMIQILFMEPCHN